MLKLVNDRTLVLNTIVGGGVVWVNEARSDVRLASLWRHDSAKASLPRETRVSYLREASSRIVGGGT